MLHSVQHDKPFTPPLSCEAEERGVERSDDRVSLIFSVKTFIYSNPHTTYHAIFLALAFKLYL